MSDTTVENMFFRKGNTLRVTGSPSANCSRFYINLGNSDKELALHVDCRFNFDTDRNTIVCNSFYWGKWDQEKRDKNFPFAEGKLFEIKIHFTCDEFVITLQDGHVIHFPKRLGGDMYKYMAFKNDAQIQGIEIM